MSAQSYRHGVLMGQSMQRARGWWLPHPPHPHLAHLCTSPSPRWLCSGNWNEDAFGVSILRDEPLSREPTVRSHTPSAHLHSAALLLDLALT